MTSFASAFGSADPDRNSEIDLGIGSRSPVNQHHPQEAVQFSTIDLDQQGTPSPKQQDQEQEHSSYVSLTDAATLRAESTPTFNNPTRVSISTSQDLPPNQFINTAHHKTSIASDRRIPLPDMATISASSAAAVAAVGPTIDKLKQWSRSTYKCTKQSIYEKLGKTTRTVDVELDGQIEV